MLYDFTTTEEQAAAKEKDLASSRPGHQNVLEGCTSTDRLRVRVEFGSSVSAAMPS